MRLMKGLRVKLLLGPCGQLVTTFAFLGVNMFLSGLPAWYGTFVLQFCIDLDPTLQTPETEKSGRFCLSR